MNKIKEVVRDLLKALIMGVGVTCIIVILFTLIGLAMNEGDLVQGLIIAQRVVILMGALGLFVVAGMLLKREGSSPLAHKKGWEKHFKKLQFAHVFFVVCTGFLLCAGLLDYWIWNIK